VLTNSSPYSISIFEGQTIGAIQKIFAEHFPFLKIEFFKILELNGIRINKKLENNYGLFRLPETEISLSEGRTIQSLKQNFFETTGLTAKIFRKSGNVWIETSLTDDWSLDRQNEEGKQMVR